MQQDLKTYQLKTEQGLELSLLNYGARLCSAKIPNPKSSQSNKLEMLLAYPKPEDYLTDEFFMGSTIGRFCNRIHGGNALINGEAIELAINEKKCSNTLHGGNKGFDKAYWDATCISEQCIEFNLLSPDSDQGFPGQLLVKARYTVNNLDIIVEYFASSDKDTLVNLCNHAYFNLDGLDDTRHGSIATQKLFIAADKFLPLTHNKVPTGDIQNVSNTKFDFTSNGDTDSFKEINPTLKSKNQQIQQAGGLDHTFVLNTDNNNKLRHAATLASTCSQISLEVHTTQNTVHVYTGNYLHSSFNKFSGICFETQNFPDSPNHKHFPDALLKAGEKYYHKTIYRFKTNLIDN